MKDVVFEAFVACARAAVPEATYASCYWAKVVSQSGNTIDVNPEDTRVPPMAGVPLTVGVPGTKLSVSAGARVLIGWSGADPRFPYVHGWDQSENAIKVTHAVSGKLELGGVGASDPVAKFNELSALLQTLIGLLAALSVAPVGATPPEVPGKILSAQALALTNLIAQLQSLASTTVFVNK